MIPENLLLGSLGETPISWFREAKGQLSDEQIQELSDSSQGIGFGVCTQDWQECTWGIIRYKTIADLEQEHGTALHVKKNWNGKTEGIQFENHYFQFYESKERHLFEGIKELPIEITEEGRCKGFFKNGGRCTRYAFYCGIKSHMEE
jgi:hypothetical protein